VWPIDLKGQNATNSGGHQHRVASELGNALKELVREVVREEVQRALVQAHRGADLLTVAAAAEVASV